jgi:hypothetical protein
MVFLKQYTGIRYILLHEEETVTCVIGQQLNIKLDGTFAVKIKTFFKTKPYL